MKISNERGFSLAEILTVVAIGTVLAAVAYPMYEGYSAKARQAEALTALSTMYSVEKMFRVENGTYTMCLSQIGYAADTKIRRYTTGFFQASVSLACGRSGNYNCYRYNFNTPSQASLAECNCGVGTVDQFGLSNNDCTWNAGPDMDPSSPNGIANYVWQATRDTMTTGAMGRIRMGHVWDVWTIDQDKSLVHVQTGN